MEKKKELKWKLFVILGAVFAFLGIIGTKQDSGLVLFLLPAFLCLIIGGILALIQNARNKAENTSAEPERKTPDANQISSAAAQTAEFGGEEPEKPKNDSAYAVLSVKIAGVTYKNRNKESRQDILRGLYRFSRKPKITLEEYEYKGEPAIRVLADGDDIGNIPAERVKSVQSRIDRIVDMQLDVDYFVPHSERDEDDDFDEDKAVYYANLRIKYLKKNHAPQS